MFERPLQRSTRGPVDRGADTLAPPPHADDLVALILGPAGAGHALPATSELLAGVIALCQGSRRKLLLPVAAEPSELAMVRSASHVLVSYYSTESTPEVVVHERAVDLDVLLRALCRSVIQAETGRVSPDAAALLSMVSMASALDLAPVPPLPRGISRSGGAVDELATTDDLAFGFHVTIPLSVDVHHDAHGFSDLHALLFGGELWAVSRGRRYLITRERPFLVAHRMVAAVRSLVDAWQAQRPLHVRLRCGQFGIAVRMDREQQVSITLHNDAGQAVTVPALSVPAAALPILRLASELIRALTSVDRAQTRNLRVSSLRSEVRLLRRLIRARHTLGGFENDQPERLRISSEDLPAIAVDSEPTRGRLAFRERWSVEIDGLDSSSTFLCGDRLVVCTPRLSLALCRDTGEVLWSQVSTHAHAAMVGRTLVRTTQLGEVLLSDVSDGLTYARSQLGQRSLAPTRVVSAGGGDLPPLAILTEGRHRLLAIDLRTGEPRWRYRARNAGAFEWRRSGRVVLIACGDGSLDALDAASGEPVWRYTDHLRFCTLPAVCQDTVIAMSGEVGGAAARLHGIDLFSGRKHWAQELNASPVSAPVEAASTVLLSTGTRGRAQLSAYEVGDGHERWCTRDPGLASGAAMLPLDQSVLFHNASGRVTAIDCESGEARWSRQVSNPLTDDVARHLDPVLRHGALFVPASRVHVMRPQDGEPLAAEPSCDLVPDFLRVDERGSFYVGEESGHLRGYGPAPRLSLVK